MGKPSDSATTARNSSKVITGLKTNQQSHNQLHKSNLPTDRLNFEFNDNIGIMQNSNFRSPNFKCTTELSSNCLSPHNYQTTSPQNLILHQRFNEPFKYTNEDIKTHLYVGESFSEGPSDLSQVVAHDMKSFKRSSPSQSCCHCACKQKAQLKTIDKASTSSQGMHDGTYRQMFGQPNMEKIMTIREMDQELEHTMNNTGNTAGTGTHAPENPVE